MALIQTVDFFTPIVDDPYSFGLIAATNALSDIYAMGGRPLTAMNIICFPVKSMELSVLQETLKGGLDKIKEAGALPSFSTVQDYKWATCITKNEGVCHGIPSSKINVENGDIITIDVGLIQDGYHLDTSITFPVGDVSKETTQFLEAGQRSLDKAIAKAKAGNTVYDISKAMDKVVQRAGYDAVYQLTGHGIGKELHQDPAVPCIPQKSHCRNIHHHA